MYDVFLSYRHDTGSEFCSFLYDLLTQEGYDVFFDADSIRQGDFTKIIDDSIQECSFLLVVLASHDLDRCLINPSKDWILHVV